MQNYKIKVNNEDESKEAQELFFELGYKWSGGHPKNDDWYSHLYTENSTCCYLSPYVWGGLADRFKEITLPQLRDLVAAHRKPTEQGLISGADALRALADGKEVEFKDGMNKWENIKHHMNLDLSMFLTAPDWMSFRLKPRTIKLELEIPACGTNYKHGQLIWILNSLEPKEYCSVILDESDELPAYWWSTEEKIKQVVAALRGALK